MADDFTFNPFTNKLDITLSASWLNGLYVLKAGDTMTGMLTITPSGATSLTCNKDIVLKLGRKLYFDGA